MAKSDPKSLSDQKYKTAMAEAVCKLRDEWQQNRSKLQSKWDKNSDAYRRISSKFWKKKETEGWRSNTFVNITKQKVLAAYALVVDSILAGGKIPFMLIPAPLENQNFDDIPEEMQEDIKRSIDDMRHLIEQQLLESHADRELMKNILAGATFGETYQKDIVHDVEYSHYERDEIELPEGVTDMAGVPPELQTWTIMRKKRKAPGVVYVPAWDIFRDMEMDDLQKSAGVIHRQLVSPYWLRKKKGKRFFINTAIVETLSEQSRTGKHPDSDTASLSPAERDITFRQNTITYLEFWGRLPRATVEAYEAERQAEDGKKAPEPEKDTTETD